ncbi:hypothetical protein [Geitlerinema sp. PCC 7407]|uniref:hypothetical protein n=1 Tax=Geitlerinema sp. PCC 7407 TaxID=1173025 RepID=UPI00029F813B|nr:hypothetical protein [Geitlerinema sp. PCC 7407]AFY66365.1 hypothetical protein GEI7407_1883 [Geitlerinema sp. PCC 7407]
MIDDNMFGHQLSLPLFEDRGEPPQEIPEMHVFRREISSEDVRAEMLLKLPKNDPQIRHLRNLHRFARRGRKGLEIITPEAAWPLIPVGKSETRRWLWNLCQRQLG